MGKSADKFSSSVEKIPPYLKKALTSLNTAHRALAGWERSLDAFQTQARRLEREADAAAQKVSAARADLDGVSGDTSKLSGKEKEEHERDKKGKQRAYDSASGELESIRSRSRALHAEYVTEADASARTIKDAADDAPPEPGWFDDLVDGFKEAILEQLRVLTDPNFWKLVGDILADVAMVIGVICLLAIPFGGIAGLALVGLLVGAGALAAHSAAMIGGAEGMTWQTLAWDAAGVLTGGLGVAGSAMARAGRGLVASGRALRASEGFLAAVSKVRPGSWGNLAHIPSGVRNSARGFVMAAEGWTHVAAGTVVDVSMTAAGAGFALGSNVNDTRWSDGKGTMGDVPILGPLAAMTKYEPPEPDVMAPGPARQPQLDAPKTLMSAGDAFTKGLDPSQFGTAA
ncbi:hypothetical protein [Streptomyces boninensis]|uniref:hypothetical protein n=1 Tax=Streptomyces boninensis TaxID=2039455 RepID=UPI003B219BDC